MIKINTISYYTLIISLTLISCRSNIDPNRHLWGQENAVWTESIYLRGYQPSTGEKLEDAHLKKYAKTLKRNGVKYAYLFAGPYGDNGHLPDYAFSQEAINSVQKLKSYFPEIIILPWVGGIQNKTVHLEDSTWVENAISDTKKLIETLNVPGVHVDFEYILPGDPYLDKTLKVGDNFQHDEYGYLVNNFHKKLRQCKPSAFISSVVLASLPDTKPWKRKTSMEELSELTKYVDQLSFLYYDTSIENQLLFEKNCSLLLKDIQRLRNINDIQYLIAIGTFINEPELRNYRHLEIENIPNSLNTIKHAALRLSQTEKIIDGIALYCDWETDRSEWKQFRKHWSGKDKY